MFRFLNPPVFQGNLRKKKYFEGWYFKQVSRNKDHVYAFIPGISLAQNDRHAFIQMINGITGETAYFNYKLEDFSFDKHALQVKIGDSFFSDQGFILDIHQENHQIKGEINFQNTTPYPSTVLEPGIMGWYSYVPFMECYHGVVSANHGLSGKITIDKQDIDFSGGKGYIEKDWGRSFPECWIWSQSNSFANFDQSFFLSVAKIPWMGKFFMGFIAFLYKDGEYIKFSTYNHSKIQYLKKRDNKLLLRMTNKDYDMDVEITANQSGDLVAPVRGKMDRMIKESIDSELSFKLANKKTGEVFQDKSDRAGLEIIEGIFDYF